MSALLAAEVEAVLEHFVNHVLVADGGADHFSTGGFYRGLESGVAHHGRHQSFFGQSFLREHVERGDGHDVVAVNQFSIFVAEQNAVGVAIVRDADVRLMFGDVVAHLRRVHRAAILVDVRAVGAMAVDDHFRAEFVQHGRRGFVGRAVPAIHDDA